MPDPHRDPERTRSRILAEATAAFAERGFASARVDDIAGRTATTTKRMIYYYFGSKEGLFAAVLEAALQTTSFDPPDEIAGETADPTLSIRWLVQQILEEDEQHPERVRLLRAANIYEAQHLSSRAGKSDADQAKVEWLRAVLQQGAEQRVFREQVDPVDLLMLVWAISDYRISHGPSMRARWNLDLLEPGVRKRQQQLVEDMLLAYLAPR